MAKFLSCFVTLGRKGKDTQAVSAGSCPTEFSGVYRYLWTCKHSFYPKEKIKPVKASQLSPVQEDLSSPPFKFHMYIDMDLKASSSLLAASQD